MAEEKTAEQTEDNSLVSDIFSVNEYEPEQPIKKHFLPWHRPRKQFVRDKQWLKLINELLEQHPPDNGVLNYLGLPGDDFLDIRYFHKHICEKRNIHIKFLGFNNSAQAKDAYNTAANVSRDEISKLPYIHSGSDIAIDNITTLASEKSLSWVKSVKAGPFDVINLDLCDGFGKHPLSNFHHSHYNALNNLLALQSKAKRPWLLFLTTRTDNDSIHEELLESLKKVYISNLTSCSNFKSVSFENFNISDEKSLEEALKNAKGLSDVFLIGIIKWMAKLSVEQNPPTKISIKSVLSYKVNDEASYHDLTSVAIRFEPIIKNAIDSTGISTVKAYPIDECEIAIQALNKINANKDVDSVLRDHEDVLNEMINESKSLLKQARYDITYYEDWARKVGLKNSVSSNN